MQSAYPCVPTSETVHVHLVWRDLISSWGGKNSQISWRKKRLNLLLIIGSETVRNKRTKEKGVRVRLLQRWFRVTEKFDGTTKCSKVPRMNEKTVAQDRKGVYNKIGDTTVLQKRKQRLVENEPQKNANNVRARYTNVQQKRKNKAETEVKKTQNSKTQKQKTIQQTKTLQKKH